MSVLFIFRKKKQEFTVNVSDGGQSLVLVSSSAVTIILAFVAAIGLLH